MKILLLSAMYPSKENMVSGIFVHQQVKKLIENGCEVKVVCPVPYVPFFLKWQRKWKSYSNIPSQDKIDGVDVYYPRYIQLPKGIFLQYTGFFIYWGIKNDIKRIYKKFKFDLFHAHAAIPIGFSAMLLNKKYKIPFVVTVHGADLQSVMQKNEKCKRNLFKVFEEANCIITVSNKLKRIIENESFGHKIKVINNGINPEEYVGLESTFNKDNRVILSVSSLIPTKGIDINIKAVSKLISKYPHLKYFIIGAGDEESYLKKLTSDLKLQNNVYFFGRQPHSKVMEFMAKADIFSLPSWLEGFGIVYIEAMAHGKPVIAVRGEGIEDVIEEGVNGFLVNPKDPDEVAMVLDELLSDDKKLKAIGECSKQSIINNYTWTNNAVKNIMVYKELLNKNS